MATGVRRPWGQRGVHGDRGLAPTVRKECFMDDEGAAVVPGNIR